MDGYPRTGYPGNYYEKTRAFEPDLIRMAGIISDHIKRKRTGPGIQDFFLSSFSNCRYINRNYPISPLAAIRTNIRITGEISDRRNGAGDLSCQNLIRKKQRSRSAG